MAFPDKPGFITVSHHICCTVMNITFQKVTNINLCLSDTSMAFSLIKNQ